MILVKITNESIKSQATKDSKGERNLTVWRLQIFRFDWHKSMNRLGFLSILQIFPSLDNKTKDFGLRHFDDYWMTDWKMTSDFLNVTDCWLSQTQIVSS